MEDKGFLRTFGNPNERITLSFDGWERYEQLRRGSPSGWNAFMALTRIYAQLDDSAVGKLILQAGELMRSE